MSEIIKESKYGEESAEGKKWEDYDTIKCPNGEVIDMQALLDDQYRAMAAFSHIAPALGGLIGKLKFIYTFQIETQATDGVHLFVNPQFTYHLNLAEKVFVMAHEVMHCLLNHLRRMGPRDPNKSNIAADYECNITLADLGIAKESLQKKIGAYIDKKYSGWGFEKIYDDVTSSGDSMDNSQQAQQAQKNQQNQQGGGGQGQSQQQNYSDDYKAGWAQAIKDYKEGKLKL